MPIAHRIVKPECLYFKPVDPDEEDPDRVQTTVSNNALVAALLQLTSLVRHADDIFCDISEECQKVFERTNRISTRITCIEESVGRLDARTVLIPVGDLKKFSQVDSHHVAKHGYDCHLFTNQNRPHSLQDQYNLCETTPIRILRSANEYRKDGLSGSKMFKLWPILLNESTVRTPDLNLPRRGAPVISFEKKYKRLKLRERPKTIHGIPELNEINKIEEVENEQNEESQCLSKSQPSILIPIDTSGLAFERMCSFRQSLTKVESEEASKKKKRRRTVTGVPEHVWNEIQKFDKKKKENHGVRAEPRSYSFDDLDAKTDIKRDETMLQYLDELQGKMDERMEEERAFKEESKIMKLFPCRRSKSLPRCVKLARSFSSERRLANGDSSSCADSSLSLVSGGSSTSSRLSRSAKRASIISNKLRSLVTGKEKRERERERPKSLDLDALDVLFDDQETNLAKQRAPSMPESIMSSRGSSEIGPGTYYSFNENNTLPRAQAKKYNFPWESLPKDWTTSVRLREISKRRSREDRQSSSGNWSGSSSNRHSLDSDNVRTESAPSYNSQASLGKDSGRDSPTEDRCGTDSTAGDDTSTLGGSKSDMDTGDGSKAAFTKLDTDTWLKSLAIRAANREDASSNSAKTLNSLSKLTKKNIMALDLMSPALRKPCMLEDEESSVYSVDQEGFYTSFHNDSGLRRSTGTLIDEDDLSPEQDSVASMCSTNTVDSVICRPGESKNYASLRKGSQQTMLSKVTPPTPPLLSTTESSDESEVNLQNSLEESLQNGKMNNDSLSESDQESIYTRLKLKTRISTKNAYPSLISISPSGSDDESMSDNMTEKFKTWHGSEMSRQKRLYASRMDQCKIVDMGKSEDTSSISSVLTLTSTDYSEYSLSSSSAMEAPPLPHVPIMKKRLPSSDNFNQEIDFYTLPNRHHAVTSGEITPQDYTNSWPRAHQKSLTPTGSILKTSERSLNPPKPPKTLNFAPVVNMFNPGTPQAVQMPLPSPSSSESSSVHMTGSNSFRTSPNSAFNYKLAMPLSSESESESKPSDLPMKYQPVITVKPGSGPPAGQRSDKSAAYVSLTPTSSQPSNNKAPSNFASTLGSPTTAINTTPSTNSNLYAVSPVNLEESMSGGNNSRAKAPFPSASDNLESGYVDMQYNSTLGYKSESMSSLASSECLNFNSASSLTYVSMASPSSSPNLSGIDIPMITTPTGSMDSLAELERTTRDCNDTYKITKSLCSISPKRSSTTETVPITTMSNSSQSTFNNTSTIGNSSMFSTFSAPVSASASLSTTLTPTSVTRPGFGTKAAMSPLTSPLLASTPEASISGGLHTKSQKRTPADSFIGSRKQTPPNSLKLSPLQSEQKRNLPTNHTTSRREPPKKRLVPSTSAPSGLARYNTPSKQGTSPIGSVSPGGSHSRTHQGRGQVNQVSPPSNGSRSADNSSRSDSYRVAMVNTNRNGSYRVAMHQSKSCPVIQPIRRAGASTVTRVQPSPTDGNPADMTYRSDSYRVAVRNTNGVVAADHTSRNSSYRVAVNDSSGGVQDNRFDVLNSVMPDGRDHRRMGITDVDQLKGLTEDPFSSQKSNGQFAMINPSNKKVSANAHVDPIAMLSSVGDSGKSGKNKNRTSTYIRFDPIFEDREDLSSSVESLRVPSLSSLKNTSSETQKGDTSYFSGKVTMYGNFGKRTSLRSPGEENKPGILNSIRTTIKSMSSKQVEVDDEWRYTTV